MFSQISPPRRATGALPAKRVGKDRDRKRGTVKETPSVFVLVTNH